MKNENSIRSQIILRIIEPLRKEKVAGIKLRAGDIQNNLELPNQIPAICSALDSQEFLQEARVSLMKREGPTRGANAVWTFRMLYQEKEIEPTDTPNAIKDENPPTTRLAETIRSWVISNIIIPARAKGVENVHLHASDVQKGLGLTNRIPAICSALDSQEFSRKAQVVLEKRDGPLQGTTVEWTFRLVPLNKDDQQPVLGNSYYFPPKNNRAEFENQLVAGRGDSGSWYCNYTFCHDYHPCISEYMENKPGPQIRIHLWRSIRSK